MSIKGDYEQALEYARAGRFHAARELLIKIDHPKAKSLLVEVDKAIALQGETERKTSDAKVKHKGKPKNNRWFDYIIIAIMVIFVCAVVAMFTMSEPEQFNNETISVTAIPTAVPATMIPEIFYTNVENVYLWACVDVGTCDKTTLPLSLTVDVVQRVQGRSVENSTLWYQVVLRDGREGYIHSSVLSTELPTPLPVQVQSAPQTQSQGRWNCTGNIYNCGDFNTCSEVMSYWNACPGDPSGLDDAPGPDGDGSPCESICSG